MIPSTVRIYVCTTPVDLRRGFDGLARVTRDELSLDPQSGALVCFVNRRANRLKVLWFEPTGYCVLYKRAHRIRFVLPDASTSERGVRLDGRGLRALLSGVPTPEKTRRKPR